MIVACACQRVGSGRLVSRPCPSTLVRLGPRRPVWKGDHYYPDHSPPGKKEASLRLHKRQEEWPFRHEIGMTERFIYMFEVIRPYFCVCFYDNCRVLGREAPSVEEGLSMRKRSRRETPEQQVDASGSTTVVPS
ncbi:hypothetical protein GW17_00059248 [Ensete ventricosum]|nr:hypothetical protein GW17_00059248 [Ensete ventricosum]